MASGESVEISNEEFAQYDRQIRLWGLDAQKRLRKAKILVVGLGGLGSEVVKNIVLAGVHSITLLDPDVVTEDVLSSQLLVTPDSLGTNLALASQARTQELNPNVNVQVMQTGVDRCADIVADFDAVCLTKASRELKIKLDEACRSRNVQFFCGDVFGFYGYCFLDLGSHDYIDDVAQQGAKKREIADDQPKVQINSVPLSGGGEQPATGKKRQSDEVICDSAKKKLDVEQEDAVVVKKVEEFCSYRSALQEKWAGRNRRQLRQSSQVFFVMEIVEEFTSQFNRSPLHSGEDYSALETIRRDVLERHKISGDFVDEKFSSCCVSALCPVAAVTGGVLAQEIIKAITRQGRPHNNFFFFDGTRHSGIVDKLCASDD